MAVHLSQSLALVLILCVLLRGMDAGLDVPLDDVCLRLLNGGLKHRLEWQTKLHNLVLALFDHVVETLLVASRLSAVVLSQPVVLSLDVQSVSFEVSTDMLEVGLVAKWLARSTSLFFEV